MKSSLSFVSFRGVMPPSSPIHRTIPLSRLPAGAEARVARLEGQAETCQRLREIGFCESAVVCRVGGDHLMVCQICGTRIALNRLLADNIHVEPLTAVR